MWGEGDVRAAEGEVLGGGELRPAGEDLIMGFEDQGGDAGGGDHHGADLAESEVQYRAEFVGEFGEGVVRGHVAEEMEVADDRESRRRGWSSEGPFSPS